MDELINLNEVIKSHNENHELFTDVHPFTLSLRISVFDSEKAMDALGALSSSALSGHRTW